MERRRFLKALGLAPLALLLPDEPEIELWPAQEYIYHSYRGRPPIRLRSRHDPGLCWYMETVERTPEWVMKEYGIK